MTINENIKKISKDIENMSGKYSTRQLFEDWIEITALSFRWTLQGINDDYERLSVLLNRYSIEERNKITEWTTLLEEACEKEMCDHIGNLYMILELNKKGLGQVFTPYHISRLMASMTFNADEFKENSIITTNDPCSGAGAMLIAFCDVARENGIDYKNRVFVVAQDLDSLCCNMCYIQLCLFDIPGIVICGNSLTEPYVGKITDDTYITGRFITNLSNNKDYESLFYDEEIKDTNYKAQSNCQIPKPVLPAIPVDKSDDFLKKANKNKLSEEYLKKCSESEKMFSN